MRKPVETQANHMLYKMTLEPDTSVDFWQTKECAIVACEIIIEFIEDTIEPERMLEHINYWKSVKEILRSR